MHTAETGLSYLRVRFLRHCRQVLLASLGLGVASSDVGVALHSTGNLLEVSFADLERDAVGTLRGIYDTFGWSGFGSLEGRLIGYTASLAGFRKNQHVDVTREEARMVVQQWRVAFTAFGYPLPAQY